MKSNKQNKIKKFIVLAFKKVGQWFLCGLSYLMDKFDEINYGKYEHGDFSKYSQGERSHYQKLNLMHLNKWDEWYN